jgi:hypothetical protein
VSRSFLAIAIVLTGTLGASTQTPSLAPAARVVQATSSAPAQPFAGSSPVYDPPAGVVPYFPTSPFSQKIPNPPTVNPRSAAWVAALAPFTLSRLAANDVSNIVHDHGEPIYLNHAGANNPVKIHCTSNFGHIPCNVEGQTVYVDPREIPQHGDAPGEDDHLALIDEPAGYEYDFWAVHEWPPQDGVLNVNWGGRCALSGNGFTNPSYTGPHWNSGCASTASGTPLTMGTIRAKDLLAAIATGGTLPQALAVAVACPGMGVPLPAPFLGSGDGRCPGNAPEGSRMYLAMHDADVNALSAAPLVKVILRTLDEDHYGAYIIDTGGQQPGIQLQTEADTTYTAWGQPGPWWTQVAPEAAREGLPEAGFIFDRRHLFQLPVPPSVGAAMRFL